METAGKSRRSAEVIVFEKRPFRNALNKKGTASTKNSSKSETPQIEFDMKTARYDVMRFGMAGFDKEKQKKDKISMAIKLGAKPPKKEYKNYKEVMAEKKEQKKQDAADKFLKQYCLEVLKQKKGARPHKKLKKKKNVKN